MDNFFVLTATKEGADSIASFGSGNRAGRAAVRAQGRQGRNLAPAGAVRSLRAAARRASEQGGRGARARRALANQIIEATSQTNRRGQSRITNRQVAEFRERLRG